MKVLTKIGKIAAVAAIAAMIAVPVAMMTACGAGSTVSGGKFGSLNTAEAVYGFSAASAGMLISAAGGGEAAALASAKGISVTTSSASVGGTDAGAETDPVIAEIEEYMTLVDGLLSDGGFTMTEEESDREAYSVRTTVTYRDISGNSLQYVMYYNEILIPDDDDDRDFGEIEEEYAIEGVLVVDGADYAIRGERNFESEEGEEESETEFRVTLGENMYLLVEQGYESETERDESEYEQEYSYSLVENGRVTERSTFSYEEEDGETELKMVTVSGGVTNTFYFERERGHGGEYIRLRVRSGNDVKSYLIRVVENADGTVTYEPVVS